MEFEPYTNIVPIDGKKTVDLETGEVGYGNPRVEKVVLDETLRLLNEHNDSFEKFVRDVTDALKKLDAEMDEIRRKYGVFP